MTVESMWPTVAKRGSWVISLARSREDAEALAVELAARGRPSIAVELIEQRSGQELLVAAILGVLLGLAVMLV